MTAGLYEYPDGDEGDAPVRARVTLVFDLRSHDPIELPAGRVLEWAADRLSRVTDNGPYTMRADLPDGGRYRRDVDFGIISWDEEAGLAWVVGDDV